ncbi:MAG: ABC transporter permease [Lachnospiraceae bacterium]|nr:ABC transporter permease [Lachnospiraceae bacterium]
MSSFDMISMAIRNLWKRKLRTFLTVLGVVIGTASIVVMISVGIGMNEGYKQQLSEMGSLNVITAYTPWQGDNENKNKNAVLDTKTIETIRNIPGVEIVTPVLDDWLMLVDGRYVTDISVTGILPEAMESLGYKLSSGRCLQEGDGMHMVLGGNVADNFYNPKQSWQYRYSGSNDIQVNVEEDKFQITYDWSYGESGADKSIKAKKINIVGVLDPMGNDSWSCVMPIDELQKIKDERDKKQKASGRTSNGNSTKKGTYETVKLKVTDLKNVSTVQDQIKEMGFETDSLMESLNAMQETSKMLQLVLGAIGAISLLVAAIGITNTMVMSIYERTREIGVMKVIGATLPDIKRLFLAEAAFIGFLGGLSGVVLSLIASKVVNLVGANLGQSSNLSLIPPWLSILGIVFATIIGVLAGYFPARRAMSLSALSAIRTE